MQEEKRIKTMEEIIQDIFPETVSPEQLDHFYDMIKRIDPEDQEQLEWFVSVIRKEMRRMEEGKRKAEEDRDRYKKDSLHDPLTGLYNLRKFRQVLKAEGNRAQRKGDYLSMLFMDFDKLKAVNDRYGNEEGNRRIKVASDCIASCIRNYDFAFRMTQGDEFSILLPSTEIEGAVAVGEKVREELRYCDVTFSMGATCYSEPSTNLDSLENDANFAMRKAKRSGKDRIVVYDGNGKAA